MTAANNTSADQTNLPIMWLASYPKSGSTWLRIILREIVAPGSEDPDIIPSVQKKTAPKSTAVLHLHGKASRLFRTHCHFGSSRIAPYDDLCMGAISIYRHPIDVFLSALNYSAVRKHAERFIGGVPKTVEEILNDGEMDHYVEEFISDRGVATFADVTGPLTDHFSGWQAGTRDLGLPFLPIRYEEMFTDPATAVTQIFEFLEIEAPHGRIDEIVSMADTRTKVDGRFFWKRRSYNFLEMLPEHCIRRCEEALAGSLEQLGYEPTTRAPINVAASL